MWGAAGAPPPETEIDRLEIELLRLNSHMIRRGFAPSALRSLFHERNSRSIEKRSLPSPLFIISCVVCLIAATLLYFNHLTGVRCLVPNDYLVWEATRPLSDCSHCERVRGPLVLRNVTRESFAAHAYRPGPIVVKGGVRHWRATRELDYDALKRLYEDVERDDEEDRDCHFLAFRSDLFSPRDVFAMSDERAKRPAEGEAWYVGWVNCHRKVLAELRKYYSRPDFLPEDAESPDSENIFFGYDRGAVMHLDYIPRLMWQGQVRGNKTWRLAPIPECEDRCEPFEFYVEPGDAVVLDTRIWYHATDIPPGQFSLTIQSEYG